MSIYTKFQAVYERLQMLEETLGDLDQVTEIVNLDARIKALEGGKEQNGLLEMLRGFAPDVVAPDFRQKFTQADLDAAVKAERERCVVVVQGWPGIYAERHASLVRAIWAGGDGGK